MLSHQRATWTTERTEKRRVLLESPADISFGLIDLLQPILQPNYSEQSVFAPCLPSIQSRGVSNRHA